jgi:hypothetical protein
MQHVSVENLHVGDLEVRCAIDHDVASIIFLPASLCIETRPIKEDPNGSVRRNIRR